MLIFGIGVVVNRNPVASALCLVVSFVGLATLFISLDAHFLGIIQILVYAGAVMVLFLFIIMLLDLQAEERRKLNAVGAGRRRSGGAVPDRHAAARARAFPRRRSRRAAAATGRRAPIYEDTKSLGALLFTQYVFHVQVIGLLLLGATIGVVALSKKEDTK